MDTTRLSERAVLSTMIISRYRAKGRSKVVDQKITDYLRTKRKAGSTQINMLKPEATAATQNAAYHLSKWYRSMTLPWDEGSRILPSALYEKFKFGHEQFLENFNRTVDEFISAYPRLLREAEDELGYELFELMEFPSIMEIRSKFGVFLTFNPVPVAGDFRVNLSNEEMQKFKTELEERNKATMSRSMHDAWVRLYGVLQDMTDRINKPQFRDSITGNIQSLIDILPGLNLVDDPDLEYIRKEVAEKICQYTASQIRNNSIKRGEVEANANNIMQNMRRLRIDLPEQAQSQAETNDEKAA